MDNAALPAPIDCHTGSTSRGEVWLELVEIDSPDEYVTHEIAVPVWLDRDGGVELDWRAARYADACQLTGSCLSASMRDRIAAWQRAGVVPDDAALALSWEESGGREARRAWLLDMAI